jgi:hypothetical protein
MGGAMEHEWGRRGRRIDYCGKARGKETTRKTKTLVGGYIRMDLGEVGWGDVDWIGLAQDRNRWRALVNSVLNLRVPRNAGKLSSGLSGSAQLHRVSSVVSLVQREDATEALSLVNLTTHSHLLLILKISYARNRPWRPIG